MPIVRAVCSTLTLVLVLGACAGGDDAADTVAVDTTLSTTTTTPPAPAAAAGRIAFTPVGASMLAGDISVEGDDNATKIDVAIRNSTDGAVHKGHVHSGTCSTIGGVVAPLNDVTIDGDLAGEASSDVTVPMATVMNGQHIVVYHEAGGTPGAPAICVAIPAHS